MSSPQNDGPAVPAEKKKGFEKYVAKFKKALGKSNIQKRLSISESSRPVAESSSSAPAAVAPVKGEAATGAAPTVSEPQQIPVDLGSAAERVEKPIRVRVHRECHVCKTDFKSEKICSKCEHRRCKECSRFPEKKSKDGKLELGEATAGLIDEKKPRYRLQITKPARAGGQVLVLKKPTQRVRRNCHSCGTMFTAGVKICGECGHVRCTDCPRDPPKALKYPYGYPNDEFGDIKAFYSCHDCNTVFPLGESKCSHCGHEKCGSCPRTLPRKVNPAVDPELIKRVEEKIALMGLSGTATVDV